MNRFESFLQFSVGSWQSSAGLLQTFVSISNPELWPSWQRWNCQQSLHGLPLSGKAQPRLWLLSRTIIQSWNGSQGRSVTELLFSHLKQFLHSGMWSVFCHVLQRDICCPQRTGPCPHSGSSCSSCDLSHFCCFNFGFSSVCSAHFNRSGPLWVSDSTSVHLSFFLFMHSTFTSTS